MAQQAMVDLEIAIVNFGIIVVLYMYIATCMVSGIFDVTPSKKKIGGIQTLPFRVCLSNLLTQRELVSNSFGVGVAFSKRIGQTVASSIC